MVVQRQVELGTLNILGVKVEMQELRLGEEEERLVLMALVSLVLMPLDLQVGLEELVMMDTVELVGLVVLHLQQAVLEQNGTQHTGQGEEEVEQIQEPILVHQEDFMELGEEEIVPMQQMMV
jgi:hypothetical protein